jgi:hypothetical protein
MRKENNQSERQTRAQQKSILGVEIKHHVIHGLHASWLGQNLGDDADKYKVDKQSGPYVIPIHIY